MTSHKTHPSWLCPKTLRWVAAVFEGEAKKCARNSRDKKSAYPVEAWYERLLVFERRERWLRSMATRIDRRRVRS